MKFIKKLMLVFYTLISILVLPMLTAIILVEKWSIWCNKGMNNIYKNSLS